MGQDSGIRITLSAEVGLGPGDTVVHGDPALPPRKGAQQSPTQLFGACLSLLCRGRGFCAVVNYIKLTIAQPPIFGPCRGQTTGWIKMPLDAEVASAQATLS